MDKLNRRRWAFSLLEMMAVVMILGIVAALVIPRLGTNTEVANRNACWTNQGDIELQSKLWRRNNGSYPTANLSNIGGDTAYFPEGVPSCPVDGTTYTIDTATGLIIGHTH